jgi:UPF0755 protein
MKRILLRLVPILVVLVAGVLILYQILWAPNEFEGDRVVIVFKGMTFKQVVDSLETRGAIRNRKLFEMAGEILNLTRDMKVGKYLLRSGMSNKQILDDLSTGRSALRITVTIPEGLRAATQARIFARELGIDSAQFVRLVHDGAFVRSLGIDARSLEGFLFPASYRFYWQPEEEEVLRQMTGAFHAFYVDSLRARAKHLGLTTTEVLAVASIVEGETMLDDERPIIAGVYYNRLRKRMRLEADPTIQYLIPGGPRRLRYGDLRITSPYNTYINYGLPPGPVNNPGAQSILAALHPARHSYLYFVATGTGGHVFSRTYNEHQNAVRRYRRLRSALDSQRG